MRSLAHLQEEKSGRQRGARGARGRGGRHLPQDARPHTDGWETRQLRQQILKPHSSPGFHTDEQAPGGTVGAPCPWVLGGLETRGPEKGHWGRRHFLSFPARMARQGHTRLLSGIFDG